MFRLLGQSFFSYSQKIRYAPVTPALLWICANIFIFQPALLYKFYAAQFDFNFFEYLFFSLPIFCLIFGVFTIPAMYGPLLWKKIYSSLIIGIAIASAISVYLSGSTGILDGKYFAINHHLSTLWINSAMLLCIVLVSGLFAFYFSQITNALLLMMCFLALLYTISFSIFFDSFHYTTKEESHFYDFSKQKNILIILLDSFQSDFFSEAMAPHFNLRKKLEGFTYYPNALGVAPTTILSIPSIHSGLIYKKKDSLASFYRKAILAHSFLTTLHAHGYKSYILNPYLKYCPEGTYCLRQGQGGEQRLFLLELTLFKIVPHFAKSWIFNKGDWIYLKPPAIISNAELDALSQHMTNRASTPTVKFIHLFSTHAPFFLNENCEKIMSRDYDRTHALPQASCALKKVIGLLETLKIKGLYNNTAILIISDHGTGLAPAHISPLRAAASPLFLFKNFNDKEPFKVSTKFVSLRDIPKTLCAISKDCGRHHYPGINILDLKKAHGYFNFNFYNWNGYVDVNKSYPITNYKFIPKKKQLFCHAIFSYQPKIMLSDPKFMDCSLTWLELGKGGNGEIIRWIRGSFTDLYIKLPSFKRINLKAEVITHDQNKDERLFVWVNNQFISQHRIYLNKINKISIHIPPSLLRHPVTHIHFAFKQFNPPRYSKEKRPLAVAFLNALTLQSE